MLSLSLFYTLCTVGFHSFSSIKRKWLNIPSPCTVFHTLSWRIVRNAWTSYRPAINGMVWRSSSCSLRGNPLLRVSILFKGSSVLWQMRTATMSWLSITRREAEAEDCIITDRQLPDHLPLAWTDDVQYFDDRVDVRTFKLYKRPSGTPLQCISLQRTRLTVTSRPSAMCLCGLN